MDETRKMLEKKMELLSQQKTNTLDELLAVTHAMVEVGTLLVRLEEQIRWRSSLARRREQTFSRAADLPSPDQSSSQEDKGDLSRQVQQLGMIVALMLEIMATWAEEEGVSLLSSQQLHGPSAQRNEQVRVLFQRIREFGETPLFKWGS